MRLPSLLLLPLFLAVLLTRPALAAPAEQIDRLWAAMRMPEVIAVMRDEGLDYGRGIDTDMLDGQGGAAWMAVVERIYDPAAMQTRAHAAFGAALADADVAPMIAFFSGDLGRRVVGLEISARRAMLDPDQDKAARDTAAAMAASEDPRIDLIRRFAETNDLFAMNVAGALNSSFAFSSGLAQGGALGPEIDQNALLAQVWAQEAQVTQDTSDWVFGFLTLAYQPLSDADLTNYTAFSASPAGQELNGAIFAAFDGMYTDISRALGLAAARVIVGQEL